MALAEVNTYLGFKYFIWCGDENLTFADFWSDLAWTLIDNTYLDDDDDIEPEKGEKRRMIDHRLLTSPKRSVKSDGQKRIQKGTLECLQFTCRINGWK